MSPQACAYRAFLSVLPATVFSIFVVAAGLEAQCQPLEATPSSANQLVGEPAGAISVTAPTSDKGIRATLQKLIPNYPNVRSVEVVVEQGVVTLDGWVKDPDTRNRVTEFARKVEGVRLVLNRMKVDQEVLSAAEVVRTEFDELWVRFSRNWLLILIAITVVMVFAALSGRTKHVAEPLLAPFVRNGLLRSVIGSLISPLVFLLGVIIALSILNLTQTVVSVLGLAGVAGLALGFAFRDIAENFIASMLLGVRPPFRIGDVVTVAGHTGTVKLLNTRATVLVTRESNHVRIPNAVVFKEIVINRTALPVQRFEFVVPISYDIAVSRCIDAVASAVKEVKEINGDPPPRVLVESLDEGTAKLKVQVWIDGTKNDAEMVMSRAKLAAKAALQRIGSKPLAGTNPSENKEEYLVTSIGRPSVTRLRAAEALATERHQQEVIESPDVVSGEGVSLLSESKSAVDGEKKTAA